MKFKIYRNLNFIRLYCRFMINNMELLFIENRKKYILVILRYCY